MRAFMLYVLAALFLGGIVSMAWWTALAERPAEVVVRSGETVASLAAEHDVAPEALAAANDAPLAEFERALAPGDVVVMPVAPASGLEVWAAHLAGLGAEILGVLLSFWLAVIAGIVPAGYRRQILGIAAALGLASYAATWAVATGDPSLTPRFVFGALKDGFAWSAAFPMFAAAFGMTRRPAEPAPRPAASPASPAPRPTPPAAGAGDEGGEAGAGV